MPENKDRYRIVAICLYIAAATETDRVTKKLQEAGWPRANRWLVVLDMAHFTSRPTRSYDVSRDGQKFLMIKGDARATNEAATTAQGAAVDMVVVLNWTEELKQRVPTR